MRKLEEKKPRALKNTCLSPKLILHCKTRSSNALIYAQMYTRYAMKRMKLEDQKFTAKR